MSTKTLSCKVRVADLERFGEVARQQGKTKSGLLQGLALAYLNDGDIAYGKPSTPISPPSSVVRQDRPSGRTRSGDRKRRRKIPSSDTSSGSPSHGEGLQSGCLPLDRLPDAPRQTTTSVVECIGLPDSVGVDDRAPAPLPKGRLPVDHSVAQGRPETSPRPSAGILLLLGLILFGWVKSRSQNAEDYEQQPHARVLSKVDGGLSFHNVGIASVYSGRALLDLCWN
jgi:hypothetical protein